MRNGGKVANRGFIFQAIVALIECLDPKNEWDQIKNEPNTNENKVDIKLFKDGRTMSAIQVKSSINEFRRADAMEWLKELRNDAKDAENICLCLVGDSFAPSCEQFIAEHFEEVKKVPFLNLQSVVILKLIEYIKRVGLGDKVMVNDLDRIDASLFSAILKNSISKEPIDRADFEAMFQKAIPKGEEIKEWFKEALSKVGQKDSTLPQCLTPIPLIDKETGLVGRDAIVGDIRKMIDESSCIVLVSGLGGIGKTAVMQGVCNDLKDDGYSVAWINCGDSLKDDLLMLRDAFNVPKEEDADKAYESVKAGIQYLGKKLYIFMDDISRDVNKEERDAINALGVHVMITSRREELPFRKKKLGCLADQDAIKMFYGYYGGDEEHRYEDTVRGIIASVNSHTLLVELVAKAAKEEGGTLDDFYETLKNDGFFAVSAEKLKTEHDENLTIEESVIKLYKISRLSDAQKSIMKLFTIFTPEKEIYYKIREWAGFGRKEMKELVDLGWLERGGLENGYYIHQIVKDSLTRQMKKAKENVRLEDYGNFLDRVIDTCSYLGIEVTYEKVRERLVLTEDVARFLNICEIVDFDAGILFNNIAGVLREQGAYEKAMKYYRKALTILERVYGTGHPSTASMYNNMSVVYYNQGVYEEAMEYARKALFINERVYGTDHLDTSKTYDNMARVFEAQGEYKKALEYYEKALAIRERVLGTGHQDTAVTYNNIAGVFQVWGDYKKALEYYGKALDICELVYGTDHSYTAKTYNNIAGVFRAQGEYNNALEYYEKALAINERVYGISHPDTANTYNNIAGVLQVQGAYDKALEYYGKALAISEQVLGTGHPSTATTYNNIAGVYEAQGVYKKALEYYEKALVINERVYGTDHHETANTYNNMAAIYNAQGCHEKALELLGRALAIRERVLGTDHSETAITYNNIADVLQEQGAYDKALEYYEKALPISEQKFGTDHPITAKIYNNLAEIFLVLFDYEKALEYCVKACVIRERVLEMGHPDTAVTYKTLAKVFLAQGDFKKALEYFKKANKIFLSAFGKNNSETQDTKQCIMIIEALEMMGIT